MSEQSAGQEELPRTAYLDHTLRRARTAAEQRSHRYVTLEHLLLALLDDPDAARLLQLTGADVAVIHSTVADAVNNRMASLVVPDGRSPSFSYRFDALFVSAAEDAKALGRRQIDGALTLIAIAKDAESNASGILAANGFSAQAALGIVRASRAPQAKSPSQTAQAKPAFAHEPTVRNPKGHDRKPAGTRPIAAQAAALVNGGDSMDDMIASVRDILEAEELKEREQAQRALPAARAEPKLKGNGEAFSTSDRAADAARLEPRIGPSQPKRVSQEGSEPAAPAFDLEKTAKLEKRAAQQRTASRSKAGKLALLAKAMESVPRNARIATPQKVQISLSSEEAGLIFGRLARLGLQRAGGGEEGCRAVTVRLTAPERGFFVEPLTPETQWLTDRPSHEAFSTWAWTVIPTGSGSHCLKVAMSAREVDANGPGGVATLPDQTIKVRVRGNFWLAFGSFVRVTVLLLAGSGLAVMAYHALKVAGKLH